LPVLPRVATHFWPIQPALPTPVTTTEPRQSAIRWAASTASGPIWRESEASVVSQDVTDQPQPLQRRRDRSFRKIMTIHARYHP
jgi:hypothetical protein